MKRDIIIIEDKTVSVTGNDVWMTAGEIAGLFHTGVPAVNAAIKAILKADVLSDYEVCRYIQLENGLYADVYSLEIIIPVSFRLNTYYTRVPHMACGQSTLEGKTAGIRDVPTERESRILLNTHIRQQKKERTATNGVVRSFFIYPRVYLTGFR